VFAITDIRLKTTELSAPFSALPHSHYITTTHSYKLAAANFDWGEGGGTRFAHKNQITLRTWSQGDVANVAATVRQIIP